MFRIRDSVDMKISLIQLRIAGIHKGIFLHLLHQLPQHIKFLYRAAFRDLPFQNDLFHRLSHSSSTARFPQFLIYVSDFLQCPFSTGFHKFHLAVLPALQNLSTYFSFVSLRSLFHILTQFS